jgi:hypothetical protein
MNVANNPVTSLEDRSLDDVGHSLGQGEETLILNEYNKMGGKKLRLKCGLKKLIFMIMHMLY